MVSAISKHPTLNPAPLVTEGIDNRTHLEPSRTVSAPPGVIELRLRELDREWDVDRLTAATSSLFLFIGLQLVSFKGEQWLVFPALVAACLMLHAFIGWTPLLPLLRVLGFRTPREIAHAQLTLETSRRDIQTTSLNKTVQDREDLSRFENEGGIPAGESPRV